MILACPCNSSLNEVSGAQLPFLRIVVGNGKQSLGLLIVEYWPITANRNWNDASYLWRMTEDSHVATLRTAMRPERSDG